jgi:transmembrane sensor
MTGDTSAQKAPLTAAEINAKASDWLQKRDFWNWSGADQADLDAWLEESWSNRVAFHRLEAAWRRTDRLAALHRPFPPSQTRSRKEKIVLFVMRSAAACVVAGLVGLGFLYKSAPQGKAYSTSVGGRETIVLADGTQIELNTDTSIRVLEEPGKRQVWLNKGEAFFAVTHNSSRPFVVWTGGRQVTDLGTKFDIRQDKSRLEVSVMEGQVSVGGTTSAPSQPLVLSKGDVLIATAESMTVIKKPGHKISRDLGWRHGMLVFDDVPLSQAIAELNRYSARRVVAADDATGRVRVSATFPTTGVEDFVQLTKSVLGLHVEQRGSETVISRSRQ